MRVLLYWGFGMLFLCICFYSSSRYHMYGRGVGTIRVLVISETRSTEMWRSRGDQGNKWVQAVVPIGHIDSEFQIQFVGTRSFSVLGDIALDDIQYQNCAYPRKCRESLPTAF